MKKITLELHVWNLILLAFINNSEELKKFKKTLLRSNSRGVYKGDSDDEYVKSFPEIQRIANEIESRRILLGKTSGFEKLYHKVTKLYFGGMAKHSVRVAIYFEAKCKFGVCGW